MFLLVPVLGGSADSQRAIPEHLVKQATAVKERHAGSLFKLPAVVGVGVGASAQHPGKAAIHVYVSRQLKEKERRAFPKDLEGVPVEVQISGPFVALPDSSQAKPKARDESPKAPQKGPTTTRK